MISIHNVTAILTAPTRQCLANPSPRHTWQVNVDGALCRVVDNHDLHSRCHGHISPCSHRAAAQLNQSMPLKDLPIPRSKQSNWQITRRQVVHKGMRCATSSGRQHSPGPIKIILTIVLSMGSGAIMRLSPQRKDMSLLIFRRASLLQCTSRRA